MKQYLQPVAWGVAMACIVALASNFALSMVVSTAQAATTHDHSHHVAPAAAEVKPGQRWATDAALREGMTRVHEAVQRNSGRSAPATRRRVGRGAAARYRSGNQLPHRQLPVAGSGRRRATRVADRATQGRRSAFRSRAARTRPAAHPRRARPLSADVR